MINGQPPDLSPIKTPVQVTETLLTPVIASVIPRVPASITVPVTALNPESTPKIECIPPLPVSKNIEITNISNKKPWYVCC
jgi:hypothetical protein